MNRSLHTIVAIVLLVGGAFSGREIFSHWMGSNAVGRGEYLAEKARHRNLHARNEKLSPERTLASLQEMLREESERPDSLELALGQMNASDLKNLAEYQNAALQNAQKNEDLSLLIDLQRAALRHLWMRDGVASLDWALGQEPKVSRLALVEGLLLEALKDHNADVLAWMDIHRSQVREMVYSNELFSLAMMSALEHGVEAVVRVHELFPHGSGVDPFQTATYPANFDFHGLYTAFAGKRPLNLDRLLSEWAFRDPESAWAAVKKDMESNEIYGFNHGNPLQSIMMGVIAHRGESDGVKWILEQTKSSDLDFVSRLLLANLQTAKLSVEGITQILLELEVGDMETYLFSLKSKDHGFFQLTQVLQELPHKVRMDFIKFVRIMSDDEKGVRLQDHFKITNEELEAHKLRRWHEH